MGWYKICIADGHFPEISIIPFIGNNRFMFSTEINKMNETGS
jgi:hypothetical protein